MSDDIHTPPALHEVWLLDTGHVIVLDQLPAAWKAALGWRRLMRLRRTVRMFVPASDLPNLPGLELGLRVAKRAFEMRDGLLRWESKPTPERLWINEEETGIWNQRECVEPYVDQVEGVINSLRNPLRIAHAHASAMPAQNATCVRSQPYTPPFIEWKDPKLKKDDKPAQPPKKKK